MDFQNWAMNLDLWRDTFNMWVDRFLGDAQGNGGGLFRGPLIAYLGITIVGVILYRGRGFLASLFNAPIVRNNRVEFKGVEGVSWGTDQEVDDLLAMGNYQKLSGKKTTDEYVSVDDEGNEQSRIKVTRWSGD
jgi:hypothetical protein